MEELQPDVIRNLVIAGASAVLFAIVWMSNYFNPQNKEFRKIEKKLKKTDKKESRQKSLRK